MSKYTKPDLVVRLRAPHMLARAVEKGLRMEAAAEIEKLRERIRELEPKPSWEKTDGVLSNRGGGEVR